MRPRLVAYVQRVQHPTLPAQKQQRRFWRLMAARERHLNLVPNPEEQS
jgi:hypothetical protein